MQTTAPLLITAIDDSEFEVLVTFEIEPAEYDGPHVFYPGGSTAEDWAPSDPTELPEIKALGFQRAFLAQHPEEPLSDYILRIAEETVDLEIPTRHFPRGTLADG